MIQLEIKIFRKTSGRFHTCNRAYLDKQAHFLNNWKSKLLNVVTFLARGVTYNLCCKSNGCEVFESYENGNIFLWLVIMNSDKV